MNQIDRLKDLLDQRGVKINWHHYPTPEQVYAQIPEDILGGVSYDTFKDHFFSDLDKMAEGGTMPEGKDGDVKRSWRKGKKMAVYMGGKWHHFGDSSMEDFRTHKSEKRKDAWYSRHKSALQGDDPRSKAFRVYAKKTWQEGGDMNEMSVPLPNGQEYVFSQDIVEPETGRPFAEVAEMLLMALQNGEIQEAEYAQMIMQLVEANEMAKQQDAAGQMGQQGMMQQPMGQPMGQMQQPMGQPISGEASMRKGGYLKDENTYVTKDGRETERGLWANVYLKKKREGMQEGGDMETGVELPEVTVTAEAPNWLKYKKEFMQENPFSLSRYVEERVNQPQTGRAAYERIDEQEFRKNVAQQGKKMYENKMYDYIQRRLVETNPQAGRPRGEWLDSFSEKEQGILTRNPRFQPTYITEFKRSLQSAFEQNPNQAFYNIYNSPDFTQKEKKEIIMEHIDNPIVSKLADAAGIFAPLSMGSKVIQSAYRDDTTIASALQGIKNDASMVEDIITDITTFVGPGTAAKFKNLLRVGKVDDAAKVLNQVSSKIPEETMQVIDDFAKEAGSFAASGVNSVEQIANQLINESSEMSSREISNLAKTLKDNLERMGISDQATDEIASQIISESSELRPREISSLAKTLKDNLERINQKVEVPQQITPKPTMKVDRPAPKVERIAQEVEELPLVDTTKLNDVNPEIKKAYDGVSGRSPITLTNYRDEYGFIEDTYNFDDSGTIELNQVISNLFELVDDEIYKLKSPDVNYDQVDRIIGVIDAAYNTLRGLKGAKTTDPVMTSNLNRQLDYAMNRMENIQKTVANATDPDMIKKSMPKPTTKAQKPAPQVERVTQDIEDLPLTNVKMVNEISNDLDKAMSVFTSRSPITLSNYRDEYGLIRDLGVDNDLYDIVSSLFDVANSEISTLSDIDTLNYDEVVRIVNNIETVYDTLSGLRRSKLVDPAMKTNMNRILKYSVDKMKSVLDKVYDATDPDMIKKSMPKPTTKAQKPAPQVERVTQDIEELPLVNTTKLNDANSEIKKAYDSVKGRSPITLSNYRDEYGFIEDTYNFDDSGTIELNQVISNLFELVDDEIYKLKSPDVNYDQVDRIIGVIDAAYNTLRGLKGAKTTDPVMTSNLNRQLDYAMNRMENIQKTVANATDPDMIKKSKPKKNLRLGGYKKMNRGGALDPNMVDGGDLVPVSDDATMVQADNPQATDSVETPNAFLDDKEVVVDMPDGRKYVFSQDLKEPETGKSFAEIAMELIQMRDQGNIPQEQFDQYIIQLADANDAVREGGQVQQ